MVGVEAAVTGAECGVLVRQGWSSSASGSVSGDSKAAAQALPSGRSVGGLLPLAGSRSERSERLGAAGAFDLEVEVEQEGGGGVLCSLPCP